MTAGGLLTDIGPWYVNLRKPGWKPPDWLFAPAWTTIFICGGAATVLAWNAADSDGRALVGVLMVANCVLNVLWSLLFFKLRRPDWALIEVPFLWLSILLPMILLAQYSAWVPWLLAPYLVWVTFATALNAAYVKLNAPFAVAAGTQGAKLR